MPNFLKSWRASITGFSCMFSTAEDSKMQKQVSFVGSFLEETLLYDAWGNHSAVMKYVRGSKTPSRINSKRSVPLNIVVVKRQNFEEARSKQRVLNIRLAIALVLTSNQKPQRPENSGCRMCVQAGKGSSGLHHLSGLGN